MKFKKLNNQKGITGIDVVIAITIISIATIAIVSLYVNIIVGSKKVTRTSAATRVATSILENIDAMYYAEVEQEINRLSNLSSIKITDSKTNATNKYVQLEVPSTADETIFNSRLNAGYNVILDITEINKPTAESGQFNLADCPLVIEVKVTVKYKVSNITEEIKLKTIKQRELLDECNEPDLNLLLGVKLDRTNRIESLNQITPIKWSSDTNSYIKTNTSDGWYSYSNKEWAKVVVTKLNTPANNTFDLVTTAVNNIDNEFVYMWIPKFGKTIEDNPEIAFTYKTSNDRIKEFNIGVNNNSKQLRFNGVAIFDGTRIIKENVKKVQNFKENETGIWINISKGVLNESDNNKKSIVEMLNNSKYGPTISHISGKYYY